MTFFDIGGQPLLAAMTGEEGPQIALGDPRDAAEAVRDQLIALDPPAHRARGHADHLRHLRDGEELGRLQRLVLVGGGDFAAHPRRIMPPQNLRIHLEPLGDRRTSDAWCLGTHVLF